MLSDSRRHRQPADRSPTGPPDQADAGQPPETVQAEIRLVRLAAAGDENAFRTLMERYQGDTYRLIWNLVPCRGDAEELLQEAFFAAYRNLARFDPDRGTFIAWILRIARNKALNFLQKKRPLLPPELPETAAQVAADTTEQQEFRTLLDNALAQLPASQRIAFVLIEIQELSYQQTSEIEQVPIGTIKSRVARAKQTLRRLLDDQQH